MLLEWLVLHMFGFSKDQGLLILISNSFEKYHSIVICKHLWAGSCNLCSWKYENVTFGQEYYLVLFDSADVIFDLITSMPLSFLNIISVISPIKHVSSISDGYFPFAITTMARVNRVHFLSLVYTVSFLSTHVIWISDIYMIHHFV